MPWGAPGETRTLAVKTPANPIEALKNHLMGAGEQLRSNALRADEQPLFLEGELDRIQLFEPLGL